MIPPDAAGVGLSVTLNWAKPIENAERVNKSERNRAFLIINKISFQR